MASRRLRTWLPCALLVALVGASTSLAAQDTDQCPPGEVPAYVLGFAELRDQVGEAMGDPITCEFPDPSGTGDIHQLTTTGLAFWRKSTNTVTFTDGQNHWSLVDGELVYQADDALDSQGTAPPPAPTATPGVAPPPAGAPVGPAPISTPAAAEVPFVDVSATSRQFLYWARRRCTHRAEAFDRTSDRASVRLNYDVNVGGPGGEGGGPADDDPTAVRLTLEWPGSASERTVAGATASALVGEVVVHWISDADGVTQEVVLPSRPADDRVTQILRGNRVAWARQPDGGYAVIDAYTVARFRIRPPTVVDATGESAPATFTWDHPSATLGLPPAFMAGATYPVHVILRVSYFLPNCA